MTDPEESVSNEDILVQEGGENADQFLFLLTLRVLMVMILSCLNYADII